MIIDDASSVIVMVQKYLREAGFNRFLTTTDATQALSMISEGAPDVILLDILMSVPSFLLSPSIPIAQVSPTNTRAAPYTG